MFSVCPPLGGGGYPGQVQMGRGTPAGVPLGRDGVPPARSGRGGVPQLGYLQQGWGTHWPGQDGGTPVGGHPGWGTPPAGMGYYPPPPPHGQDSTWST